MVNRSCHATNVDDRNETVSVEYPDINECPRCHTALMPVCLGAYYKKKATKNRPVQLIATIVFYCTKCENCFIAEFSDGRIISKSSVSFTKLGKARCYPTEYKKVEFSQNINKISSNFEMLFNQAKQAEDCGLFDICGMAYRKAVEFLIRDFSIHTNTDQSKETQIITMPLAACISENIHNDKIKSLATSCAWLGNDETHYVRKHPDRGVQDLKTFITALVHYIDLELTVEDANTITKK